jgi:hypothetical protein
VDKPAYALLNDLPEVSEPISGAEYDYTTQFLNDTIPDVDDDAYDDDISGSYVD